MLDDCVLNYVVGLVEEVVEGEEVDSDALASVRELVEGYVPAFGAVPDDRLNDWFCGAVTQIQDHKHQSELCNREAGYFQSKSCFILIRVF